MAYVTADELTALLAEERALADKRVAAAIATTKARVEEEIAGAQEDVKPPLTESGVLAALLDHLRVRPAAEPSPPAAVEAATPERVAFNIFEARGLIRPSFTHYPEEHKGTTTAVFSLWNERTFKHLTDSKRTAAVEEYRYIYASALYQVTAATALEASLAATLSDPADPSYPILQPIVDLVRNNADFALERLTILRAKSGAFPDIDEHFQEIARRSVYTDSSEWAVHGGLADLFSRHEKAKQTASISEAARAAARSAFPKTAPRTTAPKITPLPPGGGGGGGGGSEAQQVPQLQQQLQQQKQERAKQQERYKQLQQQFAAASSSGGGGGGGQRPHKEKGGAGGGTPRSSSSGKQRADKAGGSGDNE